MAEKTFTYCGFNSKTDLKMIMSEVKREILADRTVQSQDTPGKKGIDLLGMSVGAKKIEVDVTAKTSTEEEAAAYMREIANLFDTTDDSEFPLVFSDDPTVTYYAHITSISTPVKSLKGASWIDFTISFSCSEPLGHYTEKEVQVTTNPFVFVPDGEAETQPIFTCIPKKAVNKIGVANENGDYIYMSNTVDEDTQDVGVDDEPVVFNDRMNNLNLWTKLSQNTLTFNLINSVVATNTSFRTTTETITAEVRSGRPYFGDSVDGKWYGPCYQRFLPAAYTDFKVRILLKFVNEYNRAKSKIEVYLVDPQGRRIGYITIKDNDNSKIAECIVQLGGVGGVTKKLYQGEGTVVKRKETTVTKTVKVGTKTVKVKGKSTKVPVTKKLALTSDADTSSFTNFYGYIDLEKRGLKYTMKIMKLTDEGQAAWQTGINRTWTDTKNEISPQMNLASFGIHAAKYNITEDAYADLKNYKNAWMYFCNIQVNHIKNGGNVSDKQKPIAVLNDEVVLNCDTRVCSVNSFPEKTYIGSTYINNLKGGIPTTLSFTPDLKEADWYIFYVPKTN